MKVEKYSARSRIGRGRGVFIACKKKAAGTPPREVRPDKVSTDIYAVVRVRMVGVPAANP